MFTGKILSGDWGRGWLEITGMPKNFVLSVRRLVVMEESEYAELVEVRKKPEPFEQIKKLKRLLEKDIGTTKDFIEYANLMADIAIEADKVCLVASKLYSEKSDIQLKLNAKINSAHHEIVRLTTENEAFKREKAIWIMTHNKNIEKIQQLTVEKKELDKKYRGLIVSCHGVALEDMELQAKLKAKDEEIAKP